jgi:hypothetical protein
VNSRPARRILDERDVRRWVKVEFYGLPPDGLRVTDVDVAEVARNLAGVFGFEYVDGLTVVQAAPGREVS